MREGADLAGSSDLLGGQRVPAFVVPDESGCPTGQPQPPQPFLGSDLVAVERTQRLPQDWRSGSGPFADQHREPVEKQIRRSRRRRRWGRGPCRGGDVASIAWASQTTGEQGGGQRVEVEFARESRVQRLQSLGRREQQGRRLAATIGGEGDASAQDVDLGSLEFVQRARFGAGSEHKRLVQRTRLLGCLGSSQGSPGATRGVKGQHRGALEEGRGGGEAAPRPGSGCGAFELRGDLLIGHGCRLRPVPGAAIRVEVWIGRFREGAVGLAPPIRQGCPVDRRTS